MPKNQVNDPITDQEIAFARLVLSGTMTDRRAAEAAGLNPDTAAYTKSKPRVRAYMLEHSAAVRHQLDKQDAGQQSRLNQCRDRVLARLWEIAGLGPEMTRGSMSSQVKALSMIVAIEGLIPDRRAVSAPNKPAPPPVKPDIYVASWLRQQRENAASPPAPAQPEDTPEPQSPPGPADVPPPVSKPAVDLTGPSDPCLSPSPSASSVPRVPGADFVPDTRVPFSIKRNPWSRYR